MENECRISGKDFTPEQISAIRLSIQIGEQLQEDIPEIADDYRRGMTSKEIVKKYDIPSSYNISGNVAINSVRRAIAGHEGGFNVQYYKGLITDESELERLCLEHRVENGNRVYEQKVGIHGRTNEQMSEYGRKTYEQRVGIYGRTAEQMSEDSRKGGNRLYEQRLGVHGRTKKQMSENGRKIYEQGLGVHSRTNEQMSEDGRKGGLESYEQGLGVHGRTKEQMSEDGLKGVISRGLTPWREREYHNDDSNLSELECAFGLSQLPEYKKGTQINNKLIAEKINEMYHNSEPIRTASSISFALCKLRKKEYKTK